MRLVAAKARRDIDIKFLASVLCGILAVAANAFSASGTGEVSPDAHEALETPYMQKNLYSRLFGSEEPRHITWLCYYGQDREVLALSGYDLLILEADALGPVTKEDKGDRMCLAYMSIGEISQSRWFWPLVRDKPWLLEENPDWPDARRIDPASYSGSRDAVANIIRRLRRRFPEAALIANGALETAADTADCLDAVVCESTVSRWRTNEDGSVFYEQISPQDRAWLRPRLLRLRGAGLPVLALEYVAPDDAVTRQRVREAVQHAGGHP